MARCTWKTPDNPYPSIGQKPGDQPNYRKNTLGVRVRNFSTSHRAEIAKELICAKKSGVSADSRKSA